MTQKNRTQKGFTLIEMVISIFIFVIVMTATVSVFVSHIQAHAYARTVQRNLENAQFAFNFMAKTFRTSAVAAGAYAGVPRTSGPDIYVYNYSESACYHFYFTLDAITYESYAFLPTETQDIERCGDSATYANPAAIGPIELTTGNVTGGWFEFTPSAKGEDNAPPVIGHVTMAASLEDKTLTEGHVWMQTTVSLRDYPGELSF